MRTFLVALSVSLGVAVLFFFLSFLTGIQKFLFGEMLQNMNPRQLIVSYNYENSGLFQVENNQELRLDKNFVEEIKEITGVEKVAPQLVLKIPVTLEVDFLGQFFETDVPVYGIDFDFLDIDSQVNHAENILPVVVSNRLLDVYNTSLAESTGLPRLSEDGLIGREMEIIFGKSSFFTFKSNEIKKTPAKITALSNSVPVMGITIPLQKAERILAQYQSIEESEIKYSSVYLQTTNVDFNPKIQSDLEAKGFRVESLQEAEKNLNQMVWYVQKLIQIAASVVLLIALLSMSMTLFMSVMERKQEIGILRALGMQRKNVAILVLIEGFIIGILAYILGMLIALFSIKITDYFLLKFTPDVSFKPISFFTLDIKQAVFVFFFILFFVLISSYFPARKASRLDPLEALLK